ncbi:single-stranded-DNA-specific exonuclease RecJ [Accumulibacter sp.]|uniref:single-stranded-DNA-specific exonuclease RecJ n=1 Tax=Accumulibacter sp. TaxID=2053492 RepID=UPI0025FD00EA|nr:single-stranded-DNA-specific exonuclease RecJ [Accumulibacter sp.]MCM8595265.1 single-stranded-DNA-specific exonuclease RecJ [Accumulibacter sp.]MCM8627734.1 single-stranded-DNA-specific exonuclease RecJ [Accumulibacter sp.]MDS4049411.1 single-stranded-DNA-specific exonuclease RecJ [Accumulibacter sp.]
MTRLQQRSVSPRVQWQLEQQGLPSLLARIYAGRGIVARRELDHQFGALVSPESLTRAGEAAVLLADVIARGERILVVADYDCDGATACAVAIRALRAFGADVDYLVPNRFTSGYGLSPDIVELAAVRKPRLIVTVDNGISSHEGVLRARQLNIATLITDHHLAGSELPLADCIVNPNLPECTFPSKCLAGVGVIFYVMLALRAELRARGWFSAGSGRDEPRLAALLDLVALGTVADVVRLDQNNRVLVSQGLQRIRRGNGASPGVRALFHAAGRDPARASSADLGFIVGPRLNAAGRLSDMSLGIECLITDDEARALNIARQLDALNRERREIESGMQEQALQQLAGLLAGGDGEDPGGWSLFDADWHQGVIGIVAARLKEKLHRPVFAFARGDDGQIKGSGRSIAGFHLRDALDLLARRAPGLLLRFGGHAMAAGVTIRESDFPVFRELFAAIAGELLSSADRTRTIETDGGLEAAHFSIATARLLEGEVWGQGFPAPLFEDEFAVESQRVLRDRHLKLRLRKGMQTIEALHFNFAESPGGVIRAAYRLAVNDYNGVQTPQLMIEHLERAAPRAN